MLLFRVSWIYFLIRIQSPTNINSTDKQLFHDNETTRNTAHIDINEELKTILRRHEIDENGKEGGAWSDGKGEQKREHNRTQISVNGGTFYIYTLNSHFQVV